MGKVGHQGLPRGVQRVRGPKGFLRVHEGPKGLVRLRESEKFLKLWESEKVLKL